MITTELKQRVVSELKNRLGHYGSANKMAVAMDVNSAQLSRVLKGELDNVLSNANWISIARKLDVQSATAKQWLTAKTPAFVYIYRQLEMCQSTSSSGLLCDIADIGKTHTAKEYVKHNKHAIYIDCAQVKSKQKLIRQIAKELGLGHSGKYADVYSDLVFYLANIPNPLIILDEAGDLDYPAFLELKALWNATESRCGWYMMGADGLRAKIQRNLGHNKVGYAELFSRFGSTYQRVTPAGTDALREFTNAQLSLVAKVNKSEDIRKLILNSNGSLRRLKTTILKPQDN